QPALLHALRGAGAPRAARAYLRLRSRRQQRRPQERPLPARPRRPHLGHRQRPLLQRRPQAAHGALGLRRRSAPRRRARGPATAREAGTPRRAHGPAGRRGVPDARDGRAAAGPARAVPGLRLGRPRFRRRPGARNQSLGRVGCVVSDLEALRERLTAAEKWLTGTRYTHKAEKNHADVTCPWGNRLRLHRPGSDFGFMTLGMPYVEFPVPTGHADGIARFYREVMDAPARLEHDNGGAVARVQVGPGQSLRFRETSDDIRPYDGYHIAVYVPDFGRAR